MPSPVGTPHGSRDNTVAFCLGYYEACTPGCEAINNSTCLMLEDAPQPDVALRILPEYGGQSGQQGPLLLGAPELVAEVCGSSASYDLGPKLRLYRDAGVPEYVAVLVDEPRVIWHELVGGEYTVRKPDADGILRSRVFPGLWLDPRALLDGNKARLLDVLNQGLKSPEHEAFVRALAARKR